MNCPNCKIFLLNPNFFYYFNPETDTIIADLRCTICETLIKTITIL